MHKREYPFDASRRSFLVGSAAAAVGAGVATGLGVVRPLRAAPAYTITLTAADLTNLLYGLGLRASGGGGGYTIGAAIVKAILTEIPSTRYVLYSASSASDADLAVMAGGIGAPSAITPDTILTFATYAKAAIDAYSKRIGKTVTALVPVEAGPVNALLALYIGWKYGLKVFDCDGAGRAVPSLTNLTYAYNRYAIAPLFLAGKIGGVVTASEVLPPPVDAAGAEAAIRTNLGQYGNAAGLVCWGQTGAQLRNSQYLLPATLSNAIVQGEVWAAACQLPKSQVVNAMKLKMPDVIKVAGGRLTDIQTSSTPGYDDGKLTIVLDSGDTIAVHYLNENLMAELNGQVHATAPASIVVAFNVNRAGTFVLLNNGDDLPHAGVLNNECVYMIMRQSCQLYSDEMAASFSAVLAGPPFGYTGPLFPLYCDAPTKCT